MCREKGGRISLKKWRIVHLSYSLQVNVIAWSPRAFMVTQRHYSVCQAVKLFHHVPNTWCGLVDCLGLVVRSVRMVVPTVMLWINVEQQRVFRRIPDWGSWFTVSDSVAVNLISLPSEFCLSVAEMPRMKRLGWTGAWVASVGKATVCLHHWCNYCCL